MTALARPGNKPPIRMVHLGLGNFFRAHQAWYTAHAPGAEQWGIAAFTGSSTALAESLTAQGGLYTLITRSADGDRAEIVTTLGSARPGSDIEALVGCLADPRVVVVTLTVTEAGYVRGADGRLDQNRPEIQADLAQLRVGGRSLQSMPARLVAGLQARRNGGAGGLAVVACDNLPENGAAAAAVVGDLAGQLDPALARWITDEVSFVTTMVDRITPATTEDDIATAAALTGLQDAAPVVTEPFSEWVLVGDFPAGRPAWEAAGARFVSDIVPFEERKLWLLNGAHSLLAYAGSARGHVTIADAMGDPVYRGWLQQWWDEATPHLTLPDDENQDYREALVRRFTNQAIRHLLAQIAADGSQKIPVRILPVLRRERAAGRLPVGAVRVVSAWINHLRGAGAPVKDTNRAVADLASGPLDSGVTAALTLLDPTLVTDRELVAAVIDGCRALSGD